jgi:hypothetical protein
MDLQITQICELKAQSSMDRRPEGWEAKKAHSSQLIGHSLKQLGTWEARKL